MTIKVTSSYTMQNALATAYKTAAASGMLFNTLTPPTTGAATNEVSSAAYSRLALAWGATANGSASLSSSAVFSLASGDVVGAFGVCTSTTKTTADVLDWYAFGATQSFASAGTFAVSASTTIA
jgi:hypothetical protein